MDIFRTLRDDHARILAVFDAMDDADPADPQAIIRRRDELASLLSSHMQAEEDLIYPLLQADSEGHHLALLANEEHHLVDLLLQELLRLPVTDERFTAKSAILATNLEDHVEAEEDEVLPLLADLLDDAHATDLGRRFRRHVAALRQPRERAA